MYSRKKGARLLEAAAERQPREHTLKDEYLIGSAPGNDLILKAAVVSRRHALIRKVRDGFELSDLGSTNGTFVNGRRIASVRLKDGDRIEIGGQRLTFADSAAPASTPGTVALRRIKLALAGSAALFVLGFAIAEYVMQHSRAGPTQAGESLSVAQARPNSGRAAKALAPKSSSRAGPEPSAASVIGPEALLASGSPAPLSDDAGWLARLNYYRVLAGERPVAENTARSAGDLRHSRYLVMADGSEIAAGRNLGLMAHRENPANRWYTAAGARAAATSDVYYGRGSANVARMVDGWLAGPFHRLAILEPALSRVGFGNYERNGLYAAALELVPPIVPPHFYPRAVAFPPPGATVHLGAVSGEWPSPLASCPGYAEPTGLPITLQLGRAVRTHLGPHSITVGGRPVAQCAFDAGSYSNSDASVQAYARKVLLSYGAVVLIPQRPLTPGATYRVSVTAGGRRYRWSFTAGGPAPNRATEEASQVMR